MIRRASLMSGLAVLGLLLVLEWTGLLSFHKDNNKTTASSSGTRATSSGAAPATEVLEIPRPDSPPSPAPPRQAPIPPGDSTREIAGIGAALKMTDGEVIIVSIIHGAPAEKAGLIAGWIIDKVDGASTRDRPLAECIQMIRGPIGTKVKLELVEPETNERRTYEVTRDKILLK